MRKFKYMAMNLQKETFTGTFVAENEKDLAIQLSKQGLFLVTSTPYTDGTPNIFFSTSSKVNRSELTIFARQFAIMINAGVSIVGCLEILKSQKYSSLLKGVLERIYDDVKGGIMLSDSINKHKKIFPNFFRSMIRVGENSGKLDTVLISLADYYETDTAIKKKIKGAMAYPIALSVMMVGIIILMLVFIVPTFREALSDLEITPQGLTAAVYNISDFVLQNGLTILYIILAIVGIGFVFGLTEKGKYYFDVFKIKCPGVGNIIMDLIAARFARGFGLLLSSGMDVVDAMENIKIVLGNRYVEERFEKAMEDVKHGMTLTMAFQNYKLFPQMMIQMISVGEKTASLDDVLNRSCAFFDEQVESSLTSITSKIQPIMLAIMGLVVGVLFIAVYSPMLDIMSGFGA